MKILETLRKFFLPTRAERKRNSWNKKQRAIAKFLMKNDIRIRDLNGV